MTIIDWISFFIIVAGLLLYTKLCKKKIDSNQRYFVSDKKTNLFALTATLVMTELNTSTLVGFAGLGYKFGNSAIFLSLVFFFGLLFYALVVAKKWKKFDGIAVTEFFSARYHPFFGIISASFMIFAMIGFSANFLKSLTMFFEPVFPLFCEWVLSGFFCLIMLSVTIEKGLATVIRIDRVSFCLTLIIFISMIFIINPGSIEQTSIEAHSAPITFRMLLALVIITMFTYIMSPWYGQKIFSAENSRTAFYSVGIAALCITLLYGAAIYASSKLAYIYPDIIAQDVIPVLISRKFPPIIKGVSYATIFFIAMTTLAGLWNTIASLFVAHFSFYSKKGDNLLFSRGLTLLTAATSFILANVFIDKVFNKMVLMNIPIAALAFPLLGGFYWKRVSTIPAISSSLVGIVGGFGAYFYFGEPQYMWIWAIFIIPLHFLVGILLTFIKK